MLIQRAQLNFDPSIVDVRVEAGVIVAIAPFLRAAPGERVIAANGAALLPGLHDHHLHLSALAASLNSLQCGPPAVHAADELETLLRASDAAEQGSWLRGIGYHESVAGDIDRHWLDRHAPRRPVRIQHRSGRLWILNTAALERLGQLDAGDPLERERGALTGRLFDADAWLRVRLRSERPSLHAASRLLASRGVTGLTEVTARNSIADYRHFADSQHRGDLLQNVLAMGDESLDHAEERRGLWRGAVKFHFHEHELPEFDSLRAAIARSHAADRPVALHCATLGELAFALEALAGAGVRPGDRIEHASVAPADLIPRLCELGVTVVTQPNFIWERGDQYLRDIPPEHHSWLYRSRAFAAAGIPLAAGTDAPFGSADPWRAMQTAVDRRTRSGAVLGADESMSPEEAFGLFIGAPRNLAERVELAVGVTADLCLLDRPWHEARKDLAAVRVLSTLREGTVISQATLQEAA
jgi:predicted amidohydrolase YtcJ